MIEILKPGPEIPYNPEWFCEKPDDEQKKLADHFAEITFKFDQRYGQLDGTVATVSTNDIYGYVALTRNRWGEQHAKIGFTVKEYDFERLGMLADYLKRALEQIASDVATFKGGEQA